jgi:hypothetical protein
MAESELVVVDRADADLVRATAADHGVRAEELPTRGLEPVTTVTFALLGAAAAVATVVGLLERHKGGQVIDLRPGAPRAFYRSRDVVYGLVVLIAADGRVLVEVKEPTDTFATAIQALQRVAVGVGSAGSAAVGAAVRAELGATATVTVEPAPATEAAPGEPA